VNMPMPALGLHVSSCGSTEARLPDGDYSLLAQRTGISPAKLVRIHVANPTSCACCPLHDARERHARADGSPITGCLPPTWTPIRTIVELAGKSC